MNLIAMNQVSVSKMLFYFGNVYNKQRTPGGRPGDIRALASPSRPDFYAV